MTADPTPLRRWPDPPKCPLFRALGAAMLVAATALPAAAIGPPSRDQLLRLGRYDRFVRYFAAQTYGPANVSPPADYLRALILAESGANPWAVSPKGARGLTQIMPATGRATVESLLLDASDYHHVDRSKLEGFHSDYLYDPAVNLLLAAYLTALYYDAYDGDLDLVVSAWNAGPHAVERYGAAPPPYKETRRMIERMRFYLAYLKANPITERGIPERTWLDWGSPRWNAGGFNDPGWEISPELLAY